MAASLVGAVLGCAAAHAPPLVGASCDPGDRLVCETFASSRSCRCAPDADVDRVLAGFGKAAWPGALR